MTTTQFLTGIRFLGECCLMALSVGVFCAAICMVGVLFDV